MGFRFDAETAAKLRAVLDRANAQLRASALPPLTAYALVRHWIAEKIEAEFELQEPGLADSTLKRAPAGRPARSGPARVKRARKG